MSAFDLARHQRDRVRVLTRRLVFVEAELRRQYRLIGLLLQVATRDGRDCRPSALLELLCAIDGTDPARPAWVEEQERERSAAETERLIALLRETDPSRIGKAAAA